MSFVLPGLKKQREGGEEKKQREGGEEVMTEREREKGRGREGEGYGD